MRIAYLNADRGIPVLGDKGASVHVREFVTALAGLGHEVALLCAHRGEGNPCPPARLIELPPDDACAGIEEQRSRLGITCEQEDETLRRELAGLAYDRALCERVLQALDATGAYPQVLYERYALFHHAGADVAAALDIPRVLEVNAPLVEEQERYRGLRLKALAEDVETLSFLRADHVIAVSEEVRDHVLSRGVPARRVSVFPNGVDLARFHPAVDGRAVRERYGLGGAPVIGFVGSFKPWHGLDFLIEVFGRVLSHRPDAVLLAVGDGPALGDMRARAAQARIIDNIVFAGRVAHADVPHHLAAMDVTVAPYPAQNGFYFSPLKVVESLAAGRPVVAPRAGQLAALLRDGETGLLFPPGDREACAAGILELMNDPPRLHAMSRRASAAARADFGWDKTARRVVDLMSGLHCAEGAS
ncbi:MAG: glycosyltransferase [Gammaproteobacteria bacterium]|nr:glycosyltransferase [Gammaproteobacteria bacterium]